METIGELARGLCHGCGACVASCPTGAVSMRMGGDGFDYPDVDTERCVRCGRCVGACPAASGVGRSSIARYELAQLRDREALARSASGGAFLALARRVLEIGGSVVGSVWGQDLAPEHAIASDSFVLASMQGSKYVQSRVGRGVYEGVRSLVGRGVTVLFTGTPCQVAAMRSYVGDAPSLVPVDLVCHGVGSPGLFRTHVRGLRGRVGEVSSISFRDKGVSAYPDNLRLRVEGDGGTLRRRGLEDPYYAAFMRSRALRECCYSCPYASRERVGWLTLGDYLPVSGIPEGMERAVGLGLVCVSDRRGSELLSAASADLTTAELAGVPAKRNLTRPDPRPRARYLLSACRALPDGTLSGAGLVLRRTPSEVVLSAMGRERKAAVKRAVARARNRLARNMRG